MDGAPGVKPEPAESPVDEIAIEQRERYPRGRRGKARRPAGASDEPLGALPAALSGAVTHGVDPTSRAWSSAERHPRATGICWTALDRDYAPVRRSTRHSSNSPDIGQTACCFAPEALWRLYLPLP